jgi:hypothetical protein
VGVGNVWGVAFAPSNFSGQGTSGTGSAISAKVDGVTFACDKGYGTTQIRCYSGGKITISSSSTITAISFTFSGSNTGGLETSYTNLSTTSWTKTLSSQARITACTVTVAATYSVVWTINPAGYGTLSKTTGTTTTVTPGSAYTYGSPAYTVTSGGATVSQSTNSFTATPTANCTIRINMVEKPKYTITLKDDNSSLTQTTVGGSVTLPERTGCTGYTFAGWTKSWNSAQTEWTTIAPTIIPAGSYTPTADENLYPVYTKTEGASGTKSATLYYEPFGGSASSTAVQSTNVAATTDMFTDPNATVWSHYTFNAASTTSYATNLDGDKMSNGTKILKQTNNTTVTMMEVTGIKITNATNLSLSLYNRRSYTSASLKISYKIDNGSYTAVGGTIAYNSTNDKWKLSDGLTISGTGNSLALKIELVVSGTTNRTMLLDDIKVTGQVPNATTYYISDPNCCEPLAQINGSINLSHF